MVGELAVSLAGHDKGTVYLIVGEDDGSVYLADGVYKGYAAPKKKNKKHIQPIKTGLTPQQMQAVLENPADADTKIKRYIRLYHERNQ